HAPAPRRADRERSGAGRDLALVDPRLPGPAADARDRRRACGESERWRRLAADGELSGHSLAPVVLAEELQEPRLGERHLHVSALALLDVLVDVLLREREVVERVAHVLEREGDLLAGRALQDGRLEI